MSHSPNHSSVPNVTDAPIQKPGSGAITGRVFFKGKALAPKLIHMQDDPACEQEGGAPVYSEEMALNPDSTLANVFVYIKAGLGQRRFAVPATPVILDQHRCRYVPRVFGIQVGQKLKICNNDRTFHNVHASAEKNQAFNLGMSKVENVRTRSFDHAEVMIPIRCNVHAWMIAYAGVLDHPFYAVTGVPGSFAINALPPGEYVVEAWHELLGTLSQSVKLAEAETKTMDFIFQQR